jgi:predicted amino acid racemase
MNGLRLEVDLDKLYDNARALVAMASERGVSVTGVTKALFGDPGFARTLVSAGAVALGDSRVENVEGLHSGGITAPIWLIRSPMPSQIDRIVRADVVSINSEVDVLSALASAARVSGQVHEVMIMVELGDLRDGVMGRDLRSVVHHVMGLSTLRLAGITANLACRSGVEPTDENMGELSALVADVEAAFDIHVDTVSGGNSANMGWLAGSADLGRVNNLRLGEAILLGRDPLHRQPIDGLHTDAIGLVGEVIESQRKPSQPWGRSFQNAFGETVPTTGDHDGGSIWQTIVAAGRVDTDPDDLRAPAGMSVIAASSDHLIVRSDERLEPGTAVRFEVGYSALVRSMSSTFVSKRFFHSR